MNEGGDNILRKLNIVFVLSILTLLCVNAAFALDNSSSYIDNSNSDALDTKLVSNNDASAPANTFKTNEKISDNSDVKTSIDNTKSKSLTKNVNSSKDDVNLKRVAAGDAVTKRSSSTVSKKFTKSQIQTAANTLKSYVETKHTLPSFVSIGNKKVTMSGALYLLSKSIVNVNSKNGYLSLISLNGPTKITHYNLKGKWDKSNITKVASNIVSFMNSNKRAPNYVTTSLGLMQFKSAVYYLARSVTFYKNNKRLPNYVTVNDAVFTTSSPKVASLKDIEKVASEVKTYVEHNHKLPTTVVINNKKISMPEFLYLLCKKNIDTSNANSKIVGLPDKTSVTNYNLKGTWDKNNLISVAKGILNFMSSNKRAPNYMHTSIGIMQFRSLVYYMARSVTFYESHNRLPNYVTVDDSVFTGKTNTNTHTNTNDNTNTNSQFAKYLKATKNCQVNSETIKNLAKYITSGLKYKYSKAKAIFNWVRDKCSYSYYFNTNKGALTTLYTKSGNCCDLAHLVVAISRAAGVPTRYAHGNCVFRSGNVIGHVWAEVLVNGHWLKADASSNFNNFNEINNWNGVTMKGYYTELPF